MAPFWTNDRVSRMLELRAQGISARKIGLEIGTGKNAVISKLRSVGCPDQYVPIWTPSRENELRSLWTHVLPSEIGRRFGISVDAVRNKAKRMNLPKRTTFLQVDVPKRVRVAKVTPPAVVPSAKPAVIADTPKPPHNRLPVYVPTGPCLWPDKCLNVAFPVRPYSYCLEHRKIAYDRDGALYNYQLQCGLVDAA